MVVTEYMPDLQVKSFRYQLGKEILPGEQSSGLYAIVSRSKGVVLRVALTKESAEIYTECDSRYIRELFLIVE